MIRKSLANTSMSSMKTAAARSPKTRKNMPQWPASGPQTRPRFSRAATASGGSVPATRVRLRSVNIAPTSNKNSPKIIIRPTSRRRSINIGPRIIGGGGCIDSALEGEVMFRFIYITLNRELI